MPPAFLSVEEQEQIIEEGAAAVHADTPDLNSENWRLNPHQKGSFEYDLWNEGFRREERKVKAK